VDQRPRAFVQAKVAIAVVGLVSLGGVAAAAAVVDGPSAPTSVGDTATTTLATEPTTSTTDAPAEDPTTSTTMLADPTTTTLPSADAPGSAACETHGERVSQVAHATPPGPGHGAAVSTAAHDHAGECGEDVVVPASAPTPEPDHTGPDAEQAETDHVGAPAAATPTAGDHGHGGGHGRGG